MKESEFYQLYNAIYDHHSAGGCLHIVLDDFNIEDEWLEFCEIEVMELNETNPMKETYLKCLNCLRPLSEDERLEIITRACRDYYAKHKSDGSVTISRWE